MTTILLRTLGILTGLAVTSAVFGSTPMPPPRASACLEFKPGTATLSEAGEKTLDNFAGLIKRVQKDLMHFEFRYSYHQDQAGRATARMPDIKLAFDREQALLSALSSKIDSAALPNIPVSISITSYQPHDCPITIVAGFDSPAARSLCQPVSDYCVSIRCDEKGCSR